MVSSEAVPYIKTGGLADVVGSLPRYLNKEEYDVRIFLPNYLCIPEEWKNIIIKREEIIALCELV